MERVVAPTDVIIQIVILFSIWGLLSHIVVMSKFHRNCGYELVVQDIKFILFYFFFFGSLPYHLLKTIMIYIFCKNSSVSWGSTSKEMDKMSRCDAVKETFKRYLDMYIIFFLTIIGMIIMSTELIPKDWRITNIQSLVPLGLISATHIIGPIIMNPYIVSRRVV